MSTGTSPGMSPDPDIETLAGPVTTIAEVDPPPSVLEQWDRLVGRTVGTDVTQLSAWARIRAKAGYNPVYLMAFQDDQVVGGALLLHRRLFGLADIGYLPYGPVVDPRASYPSAVALALVEELTRLAGNLTVTFVQPPEGAHEISSGLLARGFRPSRAGIAPTGSYRLDLTPPLEEIRSGFSKRLKSWTNRWQSKGVSVRLSDERDLPLLVDLMAHTGARQGFEPPPLDYVRTLYHELARDGHAALFIGEVNGKPVSADLVTVVGGMVRGRLGGFDGSGPTGKLSVPAAVRWEIVKWAKARGHRWLDFGGLPERMLVDMIDNGIHSSDEWPSAQRSKLSFNGTPFRYPTAVELIRPAPVRAAYDVLRRNERGAKIIAAAKVMLRGQFRKR
ncbi:MAG: GNAT family N-acetyltransferase [Pseudonocardia sp.]|nr:GNAT family N-acetyltransferase [Pseudonocardia sp.]